MKLSNSYPYPVLCKDNDDYSKSAFSVQYDVREQFGEVRMEVLFSLQDDCIQTLIEEQQAMYLIHVECAQTSYRKTFRTNQQQLEILLNMNEVKGKVAIHSFIIATERITNYENERLNPWYQDTSITFERGNIIAIDEAIEITLYEENIEHMNLPSIISIYKSKDGELMEVDVAADHITILLPEFEYNYYARSVHSPWKHTILSLVITPCLIQVFSLIAENGDSYEEYTWHKVLKRIFAESGYDLTEVGTDKLPPLKAAQLVLRKPLKASFEEMAKLDEVEVE